MYMGHGQYLVYSSKSSIFAECIIVFQVLVYKQMLSFFEECIIVFRAPAQFPKNKRCLEYYSTNLNFGCSSLYTLATPGAHSNLGLNLILRSFFDVFCIFMCFHVL